MDAQFNSASHAAAAPAAPATHASAEFIVGAAQQS